MAKRTELNSLYYAVKIGNLTYACFFDDRDAVAYAVLMAKSHLGKWYIEDMMLGKKWLVNSDAIRL